jgi:hypothetical protein
VTPELSIVLPTDSWATIRAVLRAFATQAGAERLELVLVVPRGGSVGRDAPEAAPFASLQLVEVDDVAHLPSARLAGVLAAGAPLVLFAETHAFPQAGYVKALIDRHRGPWAVVGPRIGNANPRSLVSWASILMDYGRWLDYSESGVLDDVPGHNSAYKREALLSLGEELGVLMTADSIMHGELRRRGSELYLESDARVDHLNVSRPLWAIVERFESGRKFASIRVARFSRARRLVYAAGSPLIPLVRLKRILAEVRRSGRGPELLPRLLPVLAVSLFASALGEAVGYITGTSRTTRLYDMELHKARYVRRGEPPAT